MNRKKRQKTKILSVKNKYSFIMDKKGISEVIATLLIILFVVIIAGIVWVVIRGVIGSSSEDVELSEVKLYLRIENAQFDTSSGSEVVKVTVGREGEGDLSGVRFIFSDEENSYFVDNLTSIPKLGKKTFIFNSTSIGVNVTLMRTVSVAPIYRRKGSTKDIIGIATDNSQIGAGDLYTLELRKTGAGYGTVTSSPEGINCGTTCTIDTAYYRAGTNVTLTASSSGFGGWTSGCNSIWGPGNTLCNVTMSSNKVVVSSWSGSGGSGTS